MVTEFVKGFEKLSMNENHQIKKSVADQSRAIKQSQEAVVSAVKSEVHGLKGINKSI